MGRFALINRWDPSSASEVGLNIWARGSTRPLVPVGGTNRHWSRFVAPTVTNAPFSPGLCHEPGLKALLYKQHLAVSPKSIPFFSARRPLLHLVVAAAFDAVRLVHLTVVAASDAARLLNFAVAATLERHLTVVPAPRRRPPCSATPL